MFVTLAPASQPQQMQVFQQVIIFCDSTLYGFNLKTFRWPSQILIYNATTTPLLHELLR